MDHEQLLDAVRSECGALLFAAEAGAIDDPVPTCEGWEVRDLVVHVGQFCGFWSDVLREGTGRPKTAAPEPPSGDDPVPWLADACSSLIDVLQATDPGTEVWTWFDADRTAGFVTRRSAHEIAVHRYDAQSARGICTPVPAELAADGRRDRRRARHRPGPVRPRERAVTRPPVDRSRLRVDRDARGGPHRGRAEVRG